MPSRNFIKRTLLKILTYCSPEYPDDLPFSKSNSPRESMVISPEMRSNCQVRFVESSTPDYPTGSPIGMSEALDDLDNDCIAIAERATRNALRMEAILEIVVLQESDGKGPRVGPKPSYDGSETFELEGDYGRLL